MKHLELYEGFLSRFAHTMTGGKKLPKEAKKQLNLLSDSLVDFFNKSKWLNDSEFSKEIDYDLKFEYPRFMIKVHNKKLAGRGGSPYHLPDMKIFVAELAYRQIPPDINIIRVQLFSFKFINLNDYSNSVEIENYLNDVIHKIGSGKNKDEIPFDKIPDLLKALNEENFELYMDAKKYNL